MKDSAAKCKVIHVKINGIARLHSISDGYERELEAESDE